MWQACLTFENAERFLQGYRSDNPGCLLLDVNIPDMTGDELQTELLRRNIQRPIIFLTAYGDIPITVRLIKAGAVDFLTKPVPSALLIERIRTVLQHEVEIHQQNQEKQVFCNRLKSLATREWELVPLLTAGFSNKEIARQLGVSHRTIEIHRARVLNKTGVTSLLELARLSESQFS
jgi:FixJ family two-component response regulator